MIGEANIEAMKGDCVSIVIDVSDEKKREGCVYYYVNHEMQPVAIRDIPSVVYLSLSLSSHSSIQFISHDIYHKIILNLEDVELSYYEYPSLMKASSDDDQNVPSSSSTSLSSSDSSASLSSSLSSSSPPLSSSSFSFSSSSLSSSLSHSQAQPDSRFNYTSLSFDARQSSQDKNTNQASSDIHSVSTYNISGSLDGLGIAILQHAIHEMTDTHDIQQLLCSLKCGKDVMLDNGFRWSIAPVLSHSYSLCSVPIALTDMVCFSPNTGYPTLLNVHCLCLCLT